MRKLTLFSFVATSTVCFSGLVAANELAPHRPIQAVTIIGGCVAGFTGAVNVKLYRNNPELKSALEKIGQMIKDSVTKYTISLLGNTRVVVRDEERELISFETPDSPSQPSSPTHMQSSAPHLRGPVKRNAPATALSEGAPQGTAEPKPELDLLPNSASIEARMPGSNTLTTNEKLAVAQAA